MAPTIRRATADDWPLLREFLVKKLPTSMPVLALVRMEEEFKISRKIYVTDPDPTLFVFVTEIVSKVQSFSTFWDTERLTIEEAKNCLKSVPEWNWNPQHLMFCRQDPFFAAQLENMILRTELTSGKLEKVDDGQVVIFGLQPQRLIKASLPEGFKIGILRSHHVPFIFSFWKYSEEESVEHYQELLKILPSAAVYREGDTEDDNPVSWCLLYDHGMLGMIYTLPQFRKNGLGKAVVANLCEKLIKLGFPIEADIEFKNQNSIVMHKKLGFQLIGEAFWTIFKSPEIC